MATVEESYEVRGETVRVKAGERAPAGGRLVKLKVRWRDPDGKARAESIRVIDGAIEVARKAARDLLAEVHAAVDTGKRWTPRDAERETTIKAGAETWIADLATVQRKAAGTVEAYGGHLDTFIRWIGEGAPLSKLSRETLREYHEYLLPRYKPGSNTPAVKVQIVEVMWRWLSDHDDEIGNVPKVRKLGVSVSETAALPSPTLAEVDAVLSHLDGWTWQLGIVCRFTGLRATQALALSWDDVDFATHQITVRTGKSKREKAGRVIPVSPHLTAIMAGWGRREGLLWPGEGKDPTAPRQNPIAAMRAAFTAATEAGQIRRAVWDNDRRDNDRLSHCFRAAFAAHLTGAGAHPEARKALMGHSRGVADRYIDPETYRPAVDLVPPLTEIKANVVTLAR